MSKAYSPGEVFEGIQYLRALAAIMVVAHHATFFFGGVPGWSNFGMTGVDIFFVISGFIMVHATCGLDPKGSKAQQAADFFARRMIRVVPLYWLALVYMNKSDIRRGNIDAGLLADFAFIPRFSEEIPGEIYPSLVPGWTLNYEMLFYLLFGIALLWGARRYLVLVLAVLALVLIGQLWTFESAPALFWTRSVLGEFALGVGVYLLCSQRSMTPRPWVAVALMVLSVIALAMLAVPGIGIPRLLIFGVPAAVIVWAGVHLGRLTSPSRLLAMLGDASYSIYLTHLFTFVPCFRFLRRFDVSEPTAFNIVLVLAFCAAMATAVGVAVHYVIEKPLLRLMMALWRGRRRDASRQVVRAA
jgi:exopolysaccharide production protein ExoZ